MPLKKPPPLTKEQSIALEHDMIAAYSTDEFQRVLYEGWDAAAGDPIKQGKARQQACLPVQMEVLPKYGFEASRLGVCHSVSAYKPFNTDVDELTRSNHMAYLINPGHQRAATIPDMNISGDWHMHDITGNQSLLHIDHATGSRSFSGWIEGWAPFTEGRLCGNHLCFQIEACRCIGMVQDGGLRISDGYIWQGDTTVLSIFSANRLKVPEGAPDGGAAKEGHSLAVPLEHLDPECKLLYGGYMDGERAPSVFTRCTRCSDAEALMDYLREDPEGPFHGVVDEWPDEKAKAMPGRWGRWNFQLGGEQEPLLKADWHSVHGWGFESTAFVPRAASICHLKRAPRRVLAFMECFREVNLGCWTAVLVALETLKREAEAEGISVGSDLPWLVDLIGRVMRRRGHFGSVEAQVWWGNEAITTRSHKDGATSLLHLSLTLSGRRCVRVGAFEAPDAPQVRDPGTHRTAKENVWDDGLWHAALLRTVALQTGSVYCSAPFVFEHGVMYQRCPRHEPVIALQCRLAFADLVDAEKVNNLRNTDMRAVATVVSREIQAACDRGELRLPSLQEVTDAEKRIAFSEAKFSAGRHEDQLFSELPPPLLPE